MSGWVDRGQACDAEPTFGGMAPVSLGGIFASDVQVWKITW